MTWPVEQPDPWDALEQRSQRVYPSAEIAHLAYRQHVTQAAANHGITEAEYIRNLFEWGWENT